MNQIANRLSSIITALMLFQPLFAQSVVGEWDGQFASYINYDCEGDPFVSGTLEATVTETEITATMTTEYTFEGLCGMLGGTVDEDGLCAGMSQDDLMDLYCPILGGTYDGVSCTATSGGSTDTYTLVDDQMCITSLDSDGQETEACGTVVFTEDGFTLTMQDYADPDDPDDNDSCVLWTFGPETDDDDQGCTDPLAENYDPDADLNDGSCTYAENDDH